MSGNICIFFWCYASFLNFIFHFSNCYVKTLFWVWVFGVLFGFFCSHISFMIPFMKSGNWGRDPSMFLLITTQFQLILHGRKPGYGKFLPMTKKSWNKLTRDNSQGSSDNKSLFTYCWNRDHIRVPNWETREKHTHKSWGRGEGRSYFWCLFLFLQTSARTRNFSSVVHTE